MDKKQTNDFAEGLSGKFSEGIKEAFEKLEHQEDMQAVKETAKEVAESATEIIRKYPLQSVFGALFIGFALGSILNGRRK